MTMPGHCNSDNLFMDSRKQLLDFFNKMGKHTWTFLQRLLANRGAARKPQKIFNELLVRDSTTKRMRFECGSAIAQYYDFCLC